MAEAAVQDRWTHTSEILAAVYNTVRDVKKRAKPFAGSDFNPFARKAEIIPVPASIEAFKFFVDGTLPREVLNAGS